MPKWKTRLIINTEQNNREHPCITSSDTNPTEETNVRMITNNIKIEQGIFQGDALSPLLFCMTLMPMSHELKELKKGYKLRNSYIWMISSCSLEMKMD